MKKMLQFIWILIALQLLIFITWFNILNYQSGKHLAQHAHEPQTICEAPQARSQPAQPIIEEDIKDWTYAPAQAI